jgi:XapX domain-containing protein
MVEVLQALVIGGMVGAVFVIAGVPIPAPPSVAGVAGILGLTLSFMFLKG